VIISEELEFVEFGIEEVLIGEVVLTLCSEAGVSPVG
jgi:hypothetical protein